MQYLIVKSLHSVNVILSFAQNFWIKPSFSSLCFLQSMQPLATSGLQVSRSLWFSSLSDCFCSLFPSLLLTLRWTPNCVSKRRNMVRELNKLWKVAKSLKATVRLHWTGYDHAYFSPAQAKLHIKVNSSGWSFLCVQNQKGYNVINLHYSLTLRRVRVILGKAWETAYYLRLSSEDQAYGWTSTTFKIPWMTDGSHRVSSH